jgi:hyperosmotically inducible protein
MNADRLSASLAALSIFATVGITACDRTKSAGNEPQSPQTVGQKLDAAIDRTQQKIAEAGDKASQQLSVAGDKTMEKLSQAGQKTEAALSTAGDKIAEKTNEAVSAVKTSTGTTEVTTTTTGTTAEAAAAQPAQTSRVNDAAITASIKTDFLKDPDLSVLKIDVDTRGGVVTLNGLAGDEPARQRAEKMAGSVKGVREVRNFLVVKRA